MDGTAIIAGHVRAAWAWALPETPFDPDMSWRDAGLGSLKALDLALRLEQALGRKVALDALAPDCTANDMIVFLSRSPAAPPAPHDPRPCVFFVPGLEGDNPSQASFRRALRREVRFETLDPAGVEAPGRVLGDIPARASRLAEAVQRRQPEGQIRLAGCSFGALVAQETARQLEASGRIVAFLGLLDGFLSPPLWTPLETAPTTQRLHRARRLNAWKRRLMRWTGPLLRDTGAMELVRRAVSVRAVRDRPWARAAGLRLLRAWGYWAIRAWRPGPCRAPTLLVASEEFPAFSSVEGWRAACPQLRVVHTPGRHVQLFDPPAMAVLIPAFLDALADGASAVA
jgi:thioesterase domain-containing protein